MTPCDLHFNCWLQLSIVSTPVSDAQALSLIIMEYKIMQTHQGLHVSSEDQCHGFVSAPSALLLFALKASLKISHAPALSHQANCAACSQMPAASGSATMPIRTMTRNID